MLSILGTVLMGIGAFFVAMLALFLVLCLIVGACEPEFYADDVDDADEA
jgi:hypothetical protein